MTNTLTRILNRDPLPEDWKEDMTEGLSDIPWHRVINRLGEISLNPFQGYEIQKQLLEAEGIEFMNNGAIDLEIYSWRKE